MRAIMAYFLILAGFLCHLSTLSVGLRTAWECLARGEFRRRSGIAVIGPILVALGGLAAGSRWTLLVAAGLLLLEALVLAGSAAAIRKAGARPSAQKPARE